MRPQANDLSHYQYIDALRGLAFLGVLTVHVCQQVPTVPNFIRGLASSGQYGVQLFFLLSAITLLRSLTLRSSKESYPIRNFFVRRFFRIAPLFWFGIALYFLLYQCQPRDWAPNGLHSWHFLTTALFVQGWTPTSINSVVPGGWSIAVEMTFYLCLPLLARYITSARSALVTALASTVFAFVLAHIVAKILMPLTPANELYLIPRFVTLWFPSQLAVFLLGFALYYGINNRPFMAQVAQANRPLWLIIGAVIVYIILSRFGKDTLVPLHVYNAVAFAGVVLAVAARPYKVLVNTLTCRLGTISFSCYITHFAVLVGAEQVITSARFSFLPPSLAALVHFTTIWILGLLGTLVLSTITYFIIEKPGIKLGSWLIRLYEKKLQPPRPTSVPALVTSTTETSVTAA